MDMPKEEKKKDTPSKEEQKKNMAELYGLSLSDIEEVVLPNGKTFFKFVDPDTREIRMMEDRNDSMNLSEQFKSIQRTLSFSQGENKKENAREIFNYVAKYTNVEAELIPVTELENNKSSYLARIQALDSNAKKAIRAFLEEIKLGDSSKLGIKYINIENLFAIDRNNRVITAQYDAVLGRYSIASAETRNYENDSSSISGDTEDIAISEEEFDSFVADFDVSGDLPVVTESEELDAYSNNPNVKSGTRSIGGYAVDLGLLSMAFQYPEIISKRPDPKEVAIYMGLLRALQRKKEKSRQLSNAKQYVLKKNENKNEAAFINSILLSGLSGVLCGMIIMIILTLIKTYS